MDFDTYWTNLIDRVHRHKLILSEPEALIYHLTCIYGETMVGGIESYFERRFHEYDRDVAVLLEHGFTDIATHFDKARQVMFGDSPLNEATITEVVNRFLHEDAAIEIERKQIEAVYDRLIERLPDLLDRRDEIGVANGLFELGAEAGTVSDSGA